MTTMLMTAVAMALIMLAMAVGVIFARKPLKGSCGGVAGADCLCATEGKPMGSCDEPDAASRQRVGEDGVVIYD